jgi:hypothetical protein
MPRQVLSIANKRIRLTREDVCAASGQYSLLVNVALQRRDEVDPPMTMAYGGSVFNPCEDQACGTRASTFLINFDRSPGPGLVSASFAGRTKSGKKPDGRVQRSVIMPVHGTLIYACFFHVE